MRVRAGEWEPSVGLEYTRHLEHGLLVGNRSRDLLVAEPAECRSAIRFEDDAVDVVVIEERECVSETVESTARELFRESGGESGDRDGGPSADMLGR
ncbi:uncharacterized protein Nmag_2020 [Natrialba magadii ATCC 43099]|uniref:Uncharacterized protein n=1 Tax=Natrialba magadii (strain ATCC 43099 / DSM 3394 / CCM 3739 / CIP 104546 / IAM 13178 / JCM 8861 / NBRC 102185 / NCIMB 2190 / MS3) TaxID=547559 RepID=D3SVI2_NATMM|nr:hypothetical protein [Natrialba magadii]ADD05590.1 uncharacterized protein Nmag_2020 [Natrialba magadii ATCC 43099]ELY29997.1 hypothetical protein C500_10314 [Natrialba magadii ATCC 43099]